MPRHAVYRIALNNFTSQRFVEVNGEPGDVMCAVRSVAYNELYDSLIAPVMLFCFPLS